MKSVLTILQKELKRFFTDSRTVVMIFLPGILIFALYSLMGTFFQKSDEEDGAPVAAYFVNVPESYAAPFSEIFECTASDDAESAMEAVRGETGDIAIVWIAGEGADEVRIYYNSANPNSVAGYSVARAVLEQLQNPDFFINPPRDIAYDLADQEQVISGIYSMLIPMLTFALLASACMAYAPESIAGEKERGTIATVLITPVARWQLALGKIVSLAIVALLSGISSFVGVALSLPKLMAGSFELSYSFGDYAAILAVIVSVVLAMISLYSALSTLSKSVKEAGLYGMPLTILMLLFGMASILIPNPAAGLCAIPLFGSGLAMAGIAAFAASPLKIVLAIVSNLAFAALMTVAVAFMFKSEKIMFQR